MVIADEQTQTGGPDQRAAALEQLADRLSVSMSGTAVTKAGHTGTDTALVQQRIRDAIRGQRESWLWLVAIVAALVAVASAVASWVAVAISERVLELNQRALDPAAWSARLSMGGIALGLLLAAEFTLVQILCATQPAPKSGRSG